MKTLITLGIALIAAAALIGGFELAPTAIDWLPDLDPKFILAVIAGLTALSFAYSDSDASGGATSRGGQVARRDFVKMVTHALAITAAGWAIYFTANGQI